MCTSLGTWSSHVHMQQGLGHASLDAWSGNLVATLAMAARHGIVNFASKKCCMAAGVRVSFSIFFASQLLPDMGVCALQRPKGPTYGCFRPLPASKGFLSGTQWGVPHHSSVSPSVLDDSTARGRAKAHRPNPKSSESDPYGAY